MARKMRLTGNKPLQMASPGFIAIKSPSASGLVLIVPVSRQKVKSISPSTFKVLIRSGKEEPTGATGRTAVAASFGHDLGTSL